MDIILFTIVAVLLYFVSDRIVQRIEIAAGRRLEHRTLLFFAIIMILAVGSFYIFRTYLFAA